MGMSVAKQFSLKGCFMTIGATSVSGFADGDAFSVEALEKFERTTGADGRSIYALIPQSDRMATIRLMASSPALLPLRTAARAQWAAVEAGAQATPIPFYFADGYNGTVIAGQVVFMTDPALSYGQSPGPVEFSLSIVSPSVVMGSANLI